MKKRMLFMAVLCLLLVGLMGAVAYANDLDWATTSVRDEGDLIEFTGYFTNNRADRVITKINWMQPNVVLSYGGIDSILVDESSGWQDCYIEPGCTYEMTFYVSNPGGGGWSSWSGKRGPKYNYSYSTIKG